MCNRPANLPGARPRAFTLLEVMIAVVIIAFLVFTVHRFVRTTLTAIRVAMDYNNKSQELNGLVNYVQAQLEDLPLNRAGAITGASRKFNNLQADELTWICRGGLGVLTTAAPGEYRVTLAIQPVAKGSRELEIGLRRQDMTVKESEYSWLPLLKPAYALEFSYFDVRQNTWIDRWADAGSRPSLVRMRVWKNETDAPIEAVLAIPSARTQGVVQ